MIVLPQLADSAAVAHLGRYLADPEWWIEQKVDGHRLMVITEGEQARVYGRNGQPYSKRLPYGLINQFAVFAKMGGTTAIDGELVEDVFVAFDLPVFSVPLLDRPFSERRKLLEQVFEIWKPSQGVLLAACAKMPDDKNTIVTAVANNGGEGLMLKHEQGTYQPGRRNPRMLKCKYVSTIDCVVTSLHRNGKEAIGVGLYRDGALVEVGSVTMIGKPMNTLAVGDVVEVRYLYASADDRLYQPHFERRRDDKAARECDFAQLRYANKTTIVNLEAQP